MGEGDSTCGSDSAPSDDNLEADKLIKKLPEADKTLKRRIKQEKERKAEQEKEKLSPSKLKKSDPAPTRGSLSPTKKNELR